MENRRLAARAAQPRVPAVIQKGQKLIGHEPVSFTPDEPDRILKLVTFE